MLWFGHTAAPTRGEKHRVADTQRTCNNQTVGAYWISALPRTDGHSPSPPLPLPPSSHGTPSRHNEPTPVVTRLTQPPCPPPVERTHRNVCFAPASSRNSEAQTNAASPWPTARLKSPSNSSCCRTGAAITAEALRCAAVGRLPPPSCADVGVDVAVAPDAPLLVPTAEAATLAAGPDEAGAGVTLAGGAVPGCPRAVGESGFGSGGDKEASPTAGVLSCPREDVCPAGSASSARVPTGTLNICHRRRTNRKAGRWRQRRRQQQQQ